jgi:hypothetical protein
MVFFIVVSFLGLSTITFYLLIKQHKNNKNFQNDINSFNERQQERDFKRKSKKKKYI